MPTPDCPRRAFGFSFVACLIGWGALPVLRAELPQLQLETGVLVEWPTTTESTYQPQTSSDAGAPWVDMGEPLAGDDSPRSVYHAGRESGRRFQVVETYPVFVPAPAILANGGFEAGSGAAADGWSMAASQPPARISTDAHTGAFSIRAAILNVGATPGEGILEQVVLPAGSAIQAGQAYDFSFWIKQISSGPSYIQQYWLQWLNSSGGIVGGTGLQNFNGVIGQWTRVNVAGQTAPAGVAGVKIMFRLVTGAVSGGHGEVLIDDVEVAPVGGGSSVPSTDTRILSVTPSPAGRISWQSTAGVRYEPESSVDLVTWTKIPPAVIGDGGVKSITVPLAGPAEFFRLVLPVVVVEPPTNLRLLPSNQAGAMAVAWDASPTSGVTGYRILYGLAGGPLDQHIDVGLVTAAIIPGLVAGTSYDVAVVALAAGAPGAESSNRVNGVPDAGVGIDSLFTAATALEPAVRVETTTALVTHLADRARDRHAREAVFNSYDHYLTFYWEQRVANIEIVDEIAKGGDRLVFNYTTQAPLNPAEFRAFFLGRNTVAEYHHNAIAPLVSSHPSFRYPGETDYNYSITLQTKLPENRPLAIGDRVEVEISQFLGAVRNGRLNYYGTTFLYVVGEGVVPWYQENEYVAGGSLDSRRLPEHAWLGGLTTLPYQYSGEPEHRFKQTAGNISPESGAPFMLGRRLHHTDFGSGVHDEPDNPPLPAHANQLGPRYVARSCVECHHGNGRSLPPAIGMPLFQSVVKVAGDAAGAPHPVLGEALQSRAVSGTPEGGVTLAGYTTTNGTYGDGAAYSLRKPRYTFTGVTPEYFSVRVAPQLVGLGLLEAVPESVIEALADPADANGDGISGRMQLVADPEDETKLRLGRFTYKSAQSKVVHQIAYALNRDMGVASELFPVLDGDVSPSAPEISRPELDQMTRYVALLGVAARRDLADPIALRGEEVFTAAGCVACHAPSLPTSAYAPLAELRGQTIRPYTDLLLHDLGPGLADNLREENAAGSEWRTAPLWNIGLTAGVSGGEAYLHDGRARTLEEAILWHGGEAEAAKEAFRTAPASDRSALVKFLKSL